MWLSQVTLGLPLLPKRETANSRLQEAPWPLRFAILTMFKSMMAVVVIGELSFIFYEVYLF